MYAFESVYYFERDWICKKLNLKWDHFWGQFCGPAKHKAEGINHRKSARSLTGSRNITVGHASRGQGFIHTPHLSYPPSAFSPVQEEASSTPDTRTRSHTLAQTQWNRAVQRTKRSGKYFLICHLSLSVIFQSASWENIAWTLVPCGCFTISSPWLLAVCV